MKIQDVNEQRKSVCFTLKLILEKTQSETIKMSQWDRDAEGYINVYVDGSWLHPGTSGSAAGYGIYWGPNNSK